MNQESTPAATTRKAPRRVPTFDFDSEQPEMNRGQKSFYQRLFLPSLLAGDPVDVQGQSGYGEVLLLKLLDERRTNPIQARHTLESLVSAYSTDGGPAYAEQMLADFYFLEGDFASGRSALGWRITPSHHLTLAEYLDHPRLSAMDILRWSMGGMTKQGIRHHLSASMDALQIRLDDFHALHGVSIVEDFWQRITADRSIKEVAASVEGEVALRFTQADVLALIEDARTNMKPDEPMKAFFLWPGYEEPIDWPSPWISWPCHGALLFALFRTLMREAENAARDSAATPRVGEGWVSEMTLLRQVRESFPEERVLHQARPGWLAPQSLDIYLPNHNVAVEYQGIQHSAPVDHFGGTRAFELQQERDALKAALCKQNGCVLIEAHPGYQPAQVLTQVREAIQQNQIEGTRS